MKSLSKDFKKTLANFDESKNKLFDAVIYGLMFLKQDNFQQIAGIHPKKGKAQKILGDKLFFDLIEIEPETVLVLGLFLDFSIDVIC